MRDICIGTAAISLFEVRSVEGSKVMARCVCAWFLRAGTARSSEFPLLLNTGRGGVDYARQGERAGVGRYRSRCNFDPDREMDSPGASFFRFEQPG